MRMRDMRGNNVVDMRTLALDDLWPRWVLSQAFNPDNEYHFKNRMKTSQRNWAEVFGEENMFAVSPTSSYQKVINPLLSS